MQPDIEMHNFIVFKVYKKYKLENLGNGESHASINQLYTNIDYHLSSDSSIISRQSVVPAMASRWPPAVDLGMSDHSAPKAAAVALRAAANLVTASPTSPADVHVA